MPVARPRREDREERAGYVESLEEAVRDRTSDQATQLNIRPDISSGKQTPKRKRTGNRATPPPRTNAPRVGGPLIKADLEGLRKK